MLPYSRQPFARSSPLSVSSRSYYKYRLWMLLKIMLFMVMMPQRGLSADQVYIKASRLFLMQWKQKTSEVIDGPGTTGIVRQQRHCYADCVFQLSPHYKVDRFSPTLIRNMSFNSCSQTYKQVWVQGTLKYTDQGSVCQCYGSWAKMRVST